MKKKSLSAKKIIHKQILYYLNNKKINKNYKIFCEYLEKNNCNKKTSLCVAISGGADSLALAFLTKCFSIKKKQKVRFFIVDHKLRNDSTKEAKYVKLLLSKFDINCKILKWFGKKPKSNIQGIARNKRYGLLEKACKKNNIKNLLIGHHIDDLYENFFIRLLRGSGLKGLSSFGETDYEEKNNISILRPLINFEKHELVYISKKVFNFYVDDPTNRNFFFQRSRIRKIISEFKKEGFDKKKLNLTIKNLKSANRTINFYVRKNIESNTKLIKKNNTYILNSLFFKQSEEVIFRSISLILKTVSNRYYSSRGKSILDLILKINSNKFNKFTLGGCLIEKINKTVLITKEN